jgi:phosphoribosylanthranilate isomerase
MFERYPTRIKICGITNEDDALATARVGEDFLGFVFYPPSPRHVEPARVGEIVRVVRAALGEAAPRFIGVFVDESAERVESIRSIAGLDGVQFCGDETPETVRACAPLRIRTLSLQTLDRLGRFDVDAYLCDTHAPEQKGGTGKAYDYEQLRPWVGRYRIIVAGGLTPETVGPVVASLRPWGVDVSSALEASPGRKDSDRVRAFVEAVRRADAEREGSGIV